MAKHVTLAEGITWLVKCGDCVAMEGFTHLIPHAAGHEIIRQQLRDLTLVRMAPDVLADQLIGMGSVRKLIFSWAGNPGLGLSHRFRDAVEREWPHRLELEEHSHFGLAARFVAGASGLPFAVLRGYAGNDLAKRTPSLKTVVCPFSGEQLAAVSAVRPDVTIIHAQQADQAGNVQLWGISGVQKEAVLSASRSLVTVEEIVERIELRPGGIVIPNWVVTAVAHVPGGAHPSYASGYSTRDNSFYESWYGISRERDSFRRWMAEHVLGNRLT